MSRNLYTVVNGLIHLYRLHGCPEALVAFTTPETRGLLGALREAYAALCPRGRLEEKRLYGSLRRDAGLYESMIRRLRGEGVEVYVNVTPGTKVMSLAAYLGAVRGGADKVFYLGIGDNSYAAVLLPFIPSSLVEYVELGAPR